MARKITRKVGRIRKRAVRRRMQKKGKKKRDFRLRATKTTIHKSFGFPDRIMVKLKWNHNLMHTTNVIESLVSFYRGNLPWDPDYTAGVNQYSALEYTDFSRIYRYCRCHGSKIVVQCVNNNNNAVQIIVMPQPNNQPISSNAMSSDFRTRKTGWLVNAGRSSQTIKNYCTTRAIFGLKSPIEDADHDYDFNNVSETKPVYMWYWNIVSHNSAGINGINTSMNISITYYCEFFERRPAEYGLEELDTDGPTGPVEPAEELPETIVNIT